MFEEYAVYIGYTGIGILAMLPIYFGSFESLPHPHKPRDSEVLSIEDAYWFPVLGSVVLFGFYLVFHFFSRELVDMLILFYFSMVGTATVYHLFAPLLRSIIHQAVRHSPREFESEVDIDSSNGKSASGASKNGRKANTKRKKQTPKTLTLLDSMLEPLEYKFIYNQKGMFMNGIVLFTSVFV
jgi:hypothetical protein